MDPRPYIPKAKSEPHEQFTCRLPTRLDKKLRAAAKKANHSVNYTLTQILEAHYE